MLRLPLSPDPAQASAPAACALRRWCRRVPLQVQRVLVAPGLRPCGGHLGLGLLAPPNRIAAEPELLEGGTLREHLREGHGAALPDAVAVQGDLPQAKALREGGRELLRLRVAPAQLVEAELLRGRDDLEEGLGVLLLDEAAVRVQDEGLARQRLREGLGRGRGPAPGPAGGDGAAPVRAAGVQPAEVQQEVALRDHLAERALERRPAAFIVGRVEFSPSGHLREHPDPGALVRVPEVHVLHRAGKRRLLLFRPGLLV
mmetsp:Transcript_84356/g.273109  ORF Transcript_84356/g.273109 Transcript_84356/m.273109 type:complete len:258 (-) Transcript_84356:801-1574(-)